MGSGRAVVVLRRLAMCPNLLEHNGARVTAIGIKQREGYKQQHPDKG
jgi:hypothetical protein